MLLPIIRPSALLFLLLVLTACGADPRSVEEDLTEPLPADAPATAEATSVEPPAAPRADLAPPPAAPATYAARRRPPLADTLALEQSTGWLAFHRDHGSPTLSWASFTVADTTTVRDFPVVEYLPDPAFYELATPDADDRRRIDIYGFGAELRKRGGKIERLGSPDAAVLLIEGDLVRQLLFCGTPCTYEAVHWSGPQEVTVLGKIVTADGAGFHPYAWVIDLENRLITTLRSEDRLTDEGDYIATQLR